MRCLATLSLAIFAAVAATAAEPWFLPRPVDADTLLYASFDDDKAAGTAGGEVALRDNAAIVPGRFGQGAHLDGPKQTVVISSSEAIRFGRNDAFTVDLWVRPATSRGGALWSLCTRYYLHVGAKAQFGYRAASFPIRYTGMPTLRLTPRRWAHVALTHDEHRNVRVYVDGALVAQARHEDEGDYEKGSSSLAVGSHDTWTSFLQGDIDDVRISRGVRTFLPVVAQRYLLQGESVRLNVAPAELPPNVASARVVLRRGGETLASRELPRTALNADLVPVDDLPPGPCSVVLSFLDAAGHELSNVDVAVENAAARLLRIQARLDALETPLASRTAEALSPLARVVGLYLLEVRARVRDRRFEEAEKRLDAAEFAATWCTPEQASHRSALRRLVRTAPVPPDVRISMSWGLEPRDAFPWAERLGANELIGHGSPDRERFSTWKDKGFHTVWLHGTPIHDAAWLKDHPANQQRGFWVSKPAEATGETVTITFRTPSWSTYQPDREEATRWWKVVDSKGNAIPPERWTVDPKRNAVSVTGTTAGEEYQVYYAFRARQFLDPLAPGSAERAVEHLREDLEPFRGVLDTYWADDIGYGYPGPTEHAAWDWESYTMAAGPAQVAAFEADTGIAFDPAWLVCTPRTIDAVPDSRYTTWMTWVRDRLKPFIDAHTDTIRQLRMRSWVYWGDCHVGMEPYGGSLRSFDAVDKPSADPVTVRALTDFPGPTRRRMRTDWLFAHTARQPRMPELHWRKWIRPRRGLLRNPNVRGIYWMVFDTVASSPDDDIREHMAEVIAAVNDEFRLVTDTIGPAEAFSHDLDVVVLSAWGANYAWRPWGNRVLWHLTDLPVRVHFLAFADVAAHGLPAGTDVVFLYGMPNTAWSGGRFWNDGRVAAAVREHVRGGGGLVALQAPSAVGEHWAIADLLGVGPASNDSPALLRIDPAEFADSADEGEELREGGGGFLLSDSGREHWLARDVPHQVPNAIDTVAVARSPADSVLLAAHVAPDGKKAPGVLARETGKGRVVYLCGNSPDYAFTRLLRNAIFWSCRREADAAKLDVSGATELFSYAYPTRALLAVHNGNALHVDATVRCDPRVLGLAHSAPLRLRDVVLGGTVDVTAGQLGEGVTLPVAPYAVGLWHVGPAAPE